jgi:hypothetical protein
MAPRARPSPARQALTIFAQDLQATCLGASIVRTTPRDGTRGRPEQRVSVQ